MWQTFLYLGLPHFIKSGRKGDSYNGLHITKTAEKNN